MGGMASHLGIAHPTYRGQGSVLDSEEGIRFRGRTVSFHLSTLVSWL